MEHKGVLCDTSFFIRLLDKNDSLHNNAKDYYRYFLEHEYTLLISTIAIAEYCVCDDFDNLPLKDVQIIPFNLNHAQRTGQFAKIAFYAKNTGSLDVKERKLIPNDTKMFAQADCENIVSYYLSSDTESLKIYKLLNPHFQFIDISTPYFQTFGLLDW